MGCGRLAPPPPLPAAPSSVALPPDLSGVSEEAKVLTVGVDIACPVAVAAAAACCCRVCAGEGSNVDVAMVALVGRTDGVVPSAGRSDGAAASSPPVVGRQPGQYPAHWGSPPTMQTRDFRCDGPQTPCYLVSRRSWPVGPPCCSVTEVRVLRPPRPPPRAGAPVCLSAAQPSARRLRYGLRDARQVDLGQAGGGRSGQGLGAATWLPARDGAAEARGTKTVGAAGVVPRDPEP
jgi:hypothetical protein